MGVWIETRNTGEEQRRNNVTPCMGVWIETSSVIPWKARNSVTPCMGVWIETACPHSRKHHRLVTPCMGVWIETDPKRLLHLDTKSHPVWVCGLKPIIGTAGTVPFMSHPVWVCGLKLLLALPIYLPAEVTPCMGVWIETDLHCQDG